MGTLGMTTGLTSAPPRAAAIGGSKVSLQAAGVVGNGFSGIEAHAAWSAGNAGVPGAVSVGDMAASHAAAGPESRHWCTPAGRLKSESPAGASVAQADSDPQDRTACSAGTDRTVGAAANGTKVS